MQQVGELMSAEADNSTVALVLPLLYADHLGEIYWFSCEICRVCQPSDSIAAQSILLLLPCEICCVCDKCVFACLLILSYYNTCKDKNFRQCPP